MDAMDAIGGLELFGMRAAYDEIVTTAAERQHEPQRVVSDLLTGVRPSHWTDEAARD